MVRQSVYVSGVVAAFAAAPFARKILFLARPGYNGNRHMEAVVVDSTANSIVVEDLTGDLFEALGPEGQPIADFVIFAFNDSKQANAPTYQTQGRPTGAYLQNACHFAGGTSAPSFASGQTTFTDIDADDNGGGFAGWMIGSILVPDVNIGAPLLITGATATTLTVAGDVETVRWTVERAELCGAGSSGVASSGSQYIVYAAPFTDPAHGTWQTDPHKGGTRYLWAGYRYQPTQMGFWVDPPGAAGLGVYGAATGTNRLGQYYCWNRTYDINTGRWTTPDPVASPWWNLFDYCLAASTSSTDSSGLYSCDWCLGSELANWLITHKNSTYPIGKEGCDRLARAADRLRDLAASPRATREGINQLSMCMADVNEAMANHGCKDPAGPKPHQPKIVRETRKVESTRPYTAGGHLKRVVEGAAPFHPLAWPFLLTGCGGSSAPGAGSTSKSGMPVDDKDCTKNTDSAKAHRMENFRDCIKAHGYSPVWPKPSACYDWWNDAIAGKSGMSGRLNAAECMKEMKAQPKRFAGKWFDACKHYLCPQDLK